MMSEESQQKAGDVSGGVRVTTKAESTGIVDNLELNPWYFKTVPGILKLLQLVRNLSLSLRGEDIHFRNSHFVEKK